MFWVFLNYRSKQTLTFCQLLFSRCRKNFQDHEYILCVFVKSQPCLFFIFNKRKMQWKIQNTRGHLKILSNNKSKSIYLITQHVNKKLSVLTPVKSLGLKTTQIIHKSMVLALWDKVSCMFKVQFQSLSCKWQREDRDKDRHRGS